MTAARLVTLLVLALAAGCFGGPASERFLRSSLDANEGKLHRLQLAALGPTATADQVIALGRQRELVLVKQGNCSGGRCMLELRSKPIDRRIFRNTQSQTLSYYSRYFIDIARRGGRTQVVAIGVPVLGGEMACPDLLSRRTACKPPQLMHPSNSDLVQSVRSEWGYDVSGFNEAETLTGLLAELQRVDGRGKTPPAAPPAKRTIHAQPARRPDPQAEQLYERCRQQGREHYRRREYKQALNQFRRAFAARPTPAMRFNMASAQDKLGLAALAVRNYRAYLRSGDTVPSALSHISTRLQVLLPSVALVELTLRPATARLQLNGAPPARVMLARRTGDTLRWDLVLDPGTHQLDITGHGLVSRSITLPLLAGEQRKLELRLRRAETP